MPRGLPLSEIEKGQIIVYHDSGISNRAIAEKLDRSHNVIDRFLKNQDVHLSSHHATDTEFSHMLQIQWTHVAKSVRISTWKCHPRLLGG